MVIYTIHISVVIAVIIIHITLTLTFYFDLFHRNMILTAFRCGIYDILARICNTNNGISGNGE
jgi:hypothetical protein